MSELKFQVMIILNGVPELQTQCINLISQISCSRLINELKFVYAVRYCCTGSYLYNISIQG